MPRPRVPVEQRLLDGTYKPSRHGPLPAVSGPSGAPAKPKHVKGDAAKVWKELLGILAGRLQPSDGRMLGELCVWWARLDAINEKLAGMESGTTEFSRLLVNAGICVDKVAKMASQFGLNPTDRMKLGVVNAVSASGAKRW